MAKEAVNDYGLTIKQQKFAEAYVGSNNASKALIDAGANVNLSDANNATALHYAVMFNNKEITTLLVDAKADVNLKNNVGKTPLDFAKMHNDDTLNLILNK